MPRARPDSPSGDDEGWNGAAVSPSAPPLTSTTVASTRITPTSATNSVRAVLSEPAMPIHDSTSMEGREQQGDHRPGDLAATGEDVVAVDADEGQPGGDQQGVRQEHEDAGHEAGPRSDAA